MTPKQQTQERTDRPSTLPQSNHLQYQCTKKLWKSLRYFNKLMFHCDKTSRRSQSDCSILVQFSYRFFSCFRRCTRSKFKGRTVAASCLLRLPLRLPLTWSNHSSSGILTFRSPLIDYREEQITQTWCLICGTSNIKELSEFWIKNCFYFIGQWAQKVLTNS